MSDFWTFIEEINESNKEKISKTDFSKKEVCIWDFINECVKQDKYDIPEVSTIEEKIHDYLYDSILNAYSNADNLVQNIPSEVIEKIKKDMEEYFYLGFEVECIKIEIYEEEIRVIYHTLKSDNKREWLKRIIETATPINSAQLLNFLGVNLIYVEFDSKKKEYVKFVFADEIAVSMHEEYGKTTIAYKFISQLQKNMRLAISNVVKKEYSSASEVSIDGNNEFVIEINDVTKESF